jgi:hypothetical protein
MAEFSYRVTKTLETPGRNSGIVYELVDESSGAVTTVETYPCTRYPGTVFTNHTESARLVVEPPVEVRDMPTALGAAANYFAATGRL